MENRKFIKESAKQVEKIMDGQTDIVSYRETIKKIVRRYNKQKKNHETLIYRTTDQRTKDFLKKIQNRCLFKISDLHVQKLP